MTEKQRKPSLTKKVIRGLDQFTGFLEASLAAGDDSELLGTSGGTADERDQLADDCDAALGYLRQLVEWHEQRAEQNARRTKKT
jgi:hypothetical protein